MGTLYESDFVEWSARTAELLRERRLDEVDLENLAEEVDDLGRSWRRGLRTQLSRLLKHVIKQRIQPERDGSSWKVSISDGLSEIRSYLDDAPSLRRYAEGALPAIYAEAVRNALFETELAGTAISAQLPEICPYRLDDIVTRAIDDLATKLG